MHYACSKRFAARRGGHPKRPPRFILRAITPPGQPENAATRIERSPCRRRRRAAVEVVAAMGDVRRASRGQRARALLRARIGRSREAATLLHVAVPLCSETQTSEVWIASSPMRTGGRPMCSGASSFMWEAAAQHFQVVGAL